LIKIGRLEGGGGRAPTRVLPKPPEIQRFNKLQNVMIYQSCYLPITLNPSSAKTSRSPLTPLTSHEKFYTKMQAATYIL
jgi:hypothetical protein